MAAVPMRQSSSSSSLPPLRQSNSQSSLAQQQQAQMQDIKPALLAQSLSYRPKYTYKDKFHALRERYEQVSATNEALVKELAAAHSKMQKLEGENNLLIDGIGIIAPFDPAIEHYMNAQNTPPPPVSMSMNGADHGHSNGSDLAQATGFEAFRPSGVPVAANAMNGHGGIPRHAYTEELPHFPNH